MIKVFAAVFLTLCATIAQAMPDIKTFTTPAGTPAWLVEDHNIPFVALELRFIGGTSMDPMDKRGVTKFMMGLLEEGSGELDAQAFSIAKDDLAASFEYGAYADVLTVSAKFLTENQDQAIDLLRQSLSDPSFDSASIERVRAQIVSGIKSKAQDPSDIASAAFNSEAYPDHPYGSDDLGTLETIGTISAEDIIQAHKVGLTKDRVIVAAVGDITTEELGILVNQLLETLPESQETQMPSYVSDALKSGVKVIEFPNPQATILFGHSGIARNDDDFFAAYLLNHVLGGSGFESRLMSEVREKRGLTYGIGSFLASRRYGDLIIGQVATANETVAQTIDVITQEWQKIGKFGVTEAELQAAKTYLTGAYPLRFDGNGPIANILAGMQFQGLSPDYIKTRNDRLNAVTLEDIQRVANRLFHADQLRFVVVGQPEGLDDLQKN